MNTENNKIIAEFMGYVYTDGDFKVPHSDKTSNSNFREWCPTYWDDVLDSGGYLVAPCNLMFHSDWNWLMEVVEKIESLQYQNNNDVFKVVIDYGMCTIYNMINDLEVIVNVSKSTKIEAVYNACLEFINWYNEQNK